MEQSNSRCIAKWLDEVENTALYQCNYSKFMMRYPNGLEPYIVGVPVIA